MEKVKMFGCEGKQGPYPAITHYPMANHANGWDQFEILCSTTEKGGIGDWHVHESQEHMQLVLEGSLKINFRTGESFDLGPGEAALIKPGEEHEVINTYDGRTKYFVVYAPPR